MKNLVLLFLLTAHCLSSYAQVTKHSVMMSEVTFKDSQFNNSHASSGFLVEYDGAIYACTAKHALFFAKTDSMKTISFGDELQSWIFRSKVDPTIYVKTGKLINEDANEEITMPPLGDWLIFEIEGDVPNALVVHKLRESPLVIGEKLVFTGYPYKSETPVTVEGDYIGLTDDNNLRMDVPKGNYGGCSGGPVTDIDGRLVGIVSMGYFNKKENKMVFEPASLDYLLEILDGPR